MVHAADATPDTSASYAACAYAVVWRVIAAALVAVSRGSLLVMGVGLLTAEQSVALAVLVRALVVGALLPGAAAWLIARAHAADVAVGHSELIVRGRGLRVEVPCASIAAVVPWWLPLPGPGISVRLRSGRRLPHALQLGDPAPLLRELAVVGGVVGADATERHPIVVYAHARHSTACWRWYHVLVKFILFALVPTAVWFNAHQHIAYGGPFGQYYLEGLVPYLKTFAISWSLASIYLVLYASAWRAVAEVVALLAAAVAPAGAVHVRRAVEIGCRVVYYAGVPVLVLLPFLR